MKTTTQTLYQSSLLALCLSTAAIAGDVKMFDRPPSAEEMGNILFSGKPRAAAPAMKTRSISFSKIETVIDQPLEQRVEAADSVGLPIKFAYNSDRILQESKPYLNEVGKMLSLQEFAQEKLVVEGHTDASGSENYNQYLSERRAKAVKRYLMTNYQVSAERLFVTGMGESSPLPGLNPNAGVNRRVQFYKAP